MKKCKFFVDIEKEEMWLNEMAKQGYEFISKNSLGVYSFDSAQPNDTIIKIDYRLFKDKADFSDYCTLFEDDGWSHITGTKNSGTHYFKKINENAGDDIFSDKVSKAERYKRISKMWLTFFIIYLPTLIALIRSGSIDVKVMLNPKLLYYTPGLWEKTSINFWMAFLFETPFALMRGFLWLLILIPITLYLYFTIKTYLTYKQNLK